MKAKKQVSGKTSTKKKVKVKPKRSKKFTVSELEAALNVVEMDFENCVLKAILLGETLRSIKEDREVKGSKLELGILKRKITKEVKVWFEEFGYDVGTNYITKVFQDVPIEIKIIKRDYPFFKHPDILFYSVFEAFDIPNPWEDYWKIRGLIR